MDERSNSTQKGAYSRRESALDIRQSYSRQSTRGSVNGFNSKGFLNKKDKKQKSFSETREERPRINPHPRPGGAWDSFADHVKDLSSATASLGERKDTFLYMSSELHKIILEELKHGAVKLPDKNVNGRGPKIKTIDENNNNLSDSELEKKHQQEMDQMDTERRRALARQNWGKIRRYVDDRIKQRKQNKGGYNKEKTKNKLRAHAKINLNHEQVRQDLLERYGVVPKPGRLYPVDVMKPMNSEKAQEIIDKFQLIEIKNLKERPKTSYDEMMIVQPKLPIRPKTTHIYTRPLNLV